MKPAKERHAALRDVAERVSLWNEFRTDDFQDAVAKLVSGARELWRDGKGELPRRGADTEFDALMDLLAAVDSSPTAVRDAAAGALRAAEGTRASR
jgi:ABC-type branched-subunit amino acid transport system substrate-binding protein